MKITKRQTAEFIRDFAEALALMADGAKLPELGRAMQTAALVAHQTADKLGAKRLGLRRRGRRAPIPELAP